MSISINMSLHLTTRLKKLKVVFHVDLWEDIFNVFRQLPLVDNKFTYLLLFYWIRSFSLSIFLKRNLVTIKLY